MPFALALLLLDVKPTWLKQVIQVLFFWNDLLIKWCVLSGQFLDNLKYIEIDELESLEDYIKSCKKYITNRNQLTEVEVKIKAIRQAIAFLKSKKVDKEARYAIPEEEF